MIHLFSRGVIPKGSHHILKTNFFTGIEGVFIIWGINEGIEPGNIRGTSTYLGKFKRPF